MTRCDEFEVQLEKALHGALREDERVELQAHLAGCPSCRAFQTVVRTTEEHMAAAALTQAATVNWEGIAARVRQEQRLLKAYPLLMLASFAIQGPFLIWAMRWPLNAGPIAVFVAAGVLLSAAVHFGVRNNIRKNAEALEHKDWLVAHRRKTLDQTIKSAKTMRWLMPLVGIPVAACAVLIPHTQGRVIWVAVVSIPAIVVTALFIRYVPRAERERAELG
jgi:anti-sigma factor RsiW